MTGRAPSGQALVSDGTPADCHPSGIDPSRWLFLKDGEITLPAGSLVYALGRFGDVFGPLPPEMFHPNTWDGNMLHASHDIVAVAVCGRKWREVIPLAALAMEAAEPTRRETGSARKGDSAGPKDNAQPSGGHGHG